MEILLTIALLLATIYSIVTSKKLGRLEAHSKRNVDDVTEKYNLTLRSLDVVRTELEKQQRLNAEILSQKKSSETRLGQISENLVPFLTNCSHDPRNMHFLGNPIDYVAFDFDEGKITFLEIKSGNSKPSRRQKTVKHIIKSGRVYYEEIRINEKGVKSKKAENDG